jgi:hypothetical protein
VAVYFTQAKTLATVFNGRLYLFAILNGIDHWNFV